MSLPVTFANLSLSGYPTNSIGEAEVPAMLLDNNFVYLANTTVNTINQYTGNAIITQFGSLNVFTVTAATTVQLPIANSNNANPGILAISNSSSSTANLTIVSNGNSSDTIVGATTINAGNTYLFITDGNKTWYVIGSQSLSLPSPLPVANGGTGTTTIGANGTVAVSNGSNLTYVNPLPVSSGGTGTSTIGANNSIAVSNGSNLTYVNAPLPASLGGTGSTTIGANGTKAVSNGTNLIYKNDTLVETATTISASTTLTAVPGSTYYIYTGTANGTITLPTAASLPAYSMQMIITNPTNYTVTIATQGSDTIDFGSIQLSPHTDCCVVNDGTSTWRVLWNTATAATTTQTFINSRVSTTTIPAAAGVSYYYTNLSGQTVTLPAANALPSYTMKIIVYSIALGGTLIVNGNVMGSTTRTLNTPGGMALINDNGANLWLIESST